MGQAPSSGAPGGGKRDGKDNKDKKSKWEPPIPTRVGKKKKRGPDASSRLPPVYPTTRCKLKMLKMERIKDYLLMEEEFVANQASQSGEDRTAADRSRVDELRGSPMGVGSLEEIIDDDHAIVSVGNGPEYYVGIMSFVDKDLLEPGCSVLLHHKTHAVVGVLADDTDPMVSVMKLDKAPTESYADIDGFDTRGDVKVIMATNRIESLDPALIRPGRIDRKIEFPLPDTKTKRHIFKLHTSRMSLADDVDLEELVMTKDDLSGADIKAVCSESERKGTRLTVSRGWFTGSSRTTHAGNEGGFHDCQREGLVQKGREHCELQSK
ncbi:26S protease regulatory subunit 4 [Kwoniella bestiolae CBS 10118]|uniref:26S protease regulatory subunit 4 n=1 Tax=Kwoniella bestiolae CBS 10118 TaxID=1296100 RepID=A0AAJ8KDJ6_9TREE